MTTRATFTRLAGVIGLCLAAGTVAFSAEPKVLRLSADTPIPKWTDGDSSSFAVKGDTLVVRGGGGAGRTAADGFARTEPEVPVDDRHGRVRVRLRGEGSAAAVGLALVNPDRGWYLVSPGALAGDLELWRSTGSWSRIERGRGFEPRAGEWFRLEVELSRDGAERRWTVTAWRDGDPRPETPTIVAHEALEGAVFDLVPAIWGSGAGEASELQIESLVSVGRAPRTVEAGRWPLLVDGDRVELDATWFDASELGAPELSLSDIDAALDAAAPKTGAAAAKLLSSFPCNPYRNRFVGTSPPHSGSTAALNLPPVDNDCDGAYNEDWIDGDDNDGDGLVDEDSSLCDFLVNWSSNDGVHGAVTSGDAISVVLIIRNTWPVFKERILFVTVFGDGSAYLLTGAIRTTPDPAGVVDLVGPNGWVRYLMVEATGEPLAADVMESGAPWTDGQVYDRAVIFTAEISGGTTPYNVVATIDGLPYTPGEPYSSDGSHMVRFQVDDAGGETVVVERTFGIDTTPPAFDALQPAPGSVLELSPITITGLVSADTVEVFVAGSAATLDPPSGDWRGFTSQPTALVEGLNTASLRAVDGVGLESTAQLSLTLDTLAPVVVITTPVDGTRTPQEPITVTGSVTEANLTGLTVNGLTAAVNGSQFSAEIGLAEGLNVITAEATDALGRTGTASITVILDTTAPGVFITGPTSGWVTDAIAVSVTGVYDEPLSSVTVNGLATAFGGGSFSVDGVPLDAEGSNLITATAIDMVGNSADSPAIEVVRDTLPPTVTMDTGALPALTASPSLTVTGTAADPHLASVTVSGIPATIAGDQWTVELTLDEGDNELVATAVDSLGHSASTPAFVVTLDTAGPVVEITSPLSGEGFATSTVTVVGTAVDPHLDPASVVVDGIAATVTGSDFSVELTLPEGDTTLVAQAADTLGHSGASSPVTVTVDTLPPVVALTEPLNPLGSEAWVDVTGTVSDPHLDQVVVNGAVAAIAGSQFTATVQLSEGSNLLEATATDTYGHIAVSNTVEYILDTTPPEIAITSPLDGELLAAATVTVTGTVFDAHLEKVEVNGIIATIAGGVFTAEGVALLDGVNVIEASAEDYLNLVTTVSVTVTADTAAPAVAITEPTPGACLPAGQPIAVSGTVYDAGLSDGLGGNPPPLVLEVRTTDGATATYPAVIAADGRSWSVDGVDPGSGDGTAILSATATDLVGRTGVATASLRVDATPPVVTLLLDGGPFPGAAPGDTPPPGAEPVLLNRIVTAGVSVADGAFGAPTPTLTLDGAPYAAGTAIDAEGSHLLVATATDCAGHSAAAHVLFAIDRTPPALLSTTPADGEPLTVGPDSYAGTADEELSSATVNGAAASVVGSSFTLSPLSWREGENSVEIELTDVAGNRSSWTRTFTVSTIEPTLEITEGGLPIPDGAIYTRPVAPGFRTSPPELPVTATLDGAPFTPGATIDTTGDYTLEASATDSFGRTASDVASFRVDLEGGPTIGITSPVDEAVLTEAVVTVTGTVSGSSPTVAVNAVAAVVTGDTWTVVDLPLDPDVLNLITAIATDAAGRTASTTISVMVRTGGGQVLILEPAHDSATNRAATDVAGVVIGGRRRTADGTVTVNSIVTQVALDGSFRTLDVPLAPGANLITAEVVDPENRTDTDSITVHSDVEPPSIALSADGAPLDEGAVFSQPVTVTVTITDNVGVPVPPEVTLNGNRQPADGAVVEVPVTEDGGYLLAVTAADGAGNERLAERSFTLTGGGCGLADLSPPDGSSVASAAVTIRGRSGSAESVTVRVPIPGTSPVQYDDYAADLADGTFVAGSVPLPELGDNALLVECTGADGATVSETLTIHRLPDGDGPQIAITDPGADQLLDVRTLTVTGTVSEASAAVTVNGRPATVTEQPDGSGVFTVDVPLTEGPNVLAARALDAVGRSGADRIVVRLDTRAPPVTITSPENNSWHGPRGDGSAVVDVAGLIDLTAEPNLVEVVASTAVGSVTAAVDTATGAFVAVGVPLDPTVLPADLQTVTVTATDQNGHLSTASVGVHLDATGPAVVIDAPPDLGRYHEASPPDLTVSGEAWAAEGSSVSVNGATIDPTLLAWDGPVADGRFHTSFAVDLPRPTEDGPFGVIARASQLDGRWAGTRRLLFVDATPPEVLEVIPADGTTGVDADGLLLVLFSEPVLQSSLSAPDGLGLTRLDTGESVVGHVAVSGNAVAFTPGAAMARGVDYRFSVGAGVTDLVGHPVAVPREVVFTTAADAISAAPTLDPLPAVVCAPSLDVTGTTAPNTSVRLRDGDLSFTATADAAGRFTVTVPLSGDGYHVLEAAAVDRFGTAGPAATAVVRVDCRGPQVERTNLDLVGAAITVELSEAVDPASTTFGAPGAAVRLFDNDDPGAGDQAGTLQLSPDGATLEILLDSAPDAWWRDTVIRLVIGPPLADEQGNQMAAPVESLLFPSGGGGLAGGFLFGEVYDDASGRPLAGASVGLYPAGAALPGAVQAGAEDPPLAVATTDARGRFQILDEVAAGRYTLLVEGADHVRVVRQLALAPATGVVPFDNRSTPLGDAAGTLDPVAGGQLAEPANPLLKLTADPAAVPGLDPLTLHLVARSGQGLPDALPLGWTPLAAADVVLLDAAGTALPDGDATPFAAGATHLELPLPDWVVPGDTLVAVRYHLTGGQWLTLADVELLSGPGGEPVARVPLVGPGSVAVVLPDEGDGAPPLPDAGAGHPLRGVDLPFELPELTASLSLDPPVIPPTGRAAASVVALSADGVTPWPSGLAVQAYLEEQLILSGGVEQIVEAPFVADLLLYRSRLDAGQLGGNTPESAGAADFAVSPSERAAQVLLDVGYENIRVYPFPGQLERGQVLGPTGGAVTSADGVELSLPEGALPAKTVVRAALLPADDLAALPPVLGYDTLAAVRIELGGYELARSATLSLDAPAGTPDPVPGDPRLVLAELVEIPADGRGSYPGLVARIGRAGDRLTATPEAPGSGLALDGVRREGLYLVLHAQGSIAYATGLVTAPNGVGLELARVAADGLGTADVSALGGRYAVPIQAVPATTVEALHPTSDERGTGVVAAVVPDEVVALDIAIEQVGPAVVELTPPDGAVDQPVGTAVSVRFTEELDPATVGPGTLTLALADATGRPTGATVLGAVSLSPDGTRITFAPNLPLAPGRTWAATFSGGVTDTGGTPYVDGPLEWSFTTSTVVVPGGQVHPELFRIQMPVDGVAQIYGEPGALPTVPTGNPPWAVSPFVVRDAADPVRDTFSADTVGGFTGFVGHPPDYPVTIHDEVWVDVFDPNGDLAARFRFPVFSTPDGRGFVAPPGEAVSFTTADGITVEVPEGAFDEATPVTVTPLDPATVGVDTPTGLGLGAYIDVDFDGEANETLRIKVPAPPGIDPAAQVFIGEPVNVPWGRRIKMLSVGGVLEESSALFLSNDPSLQPEPEPGGGLKDFGQGTYNCQNALEEGLPQCFIQTLLAEFAFRSTAAFFYEQGAEWTVMTYGLSSFPMSVGFSNSVFYNFLADLFVYVPVPHDWSGHVVLPVLENSPFQLIERDVATGWILSEHDQIFVPENPDALFQYVDINPEDLERPLLVGAYPFDFLRFNPPPPGERQQLRLELAIQSDPSGTFDLLENATFPLSEGTGLALLNTDPSANWNSARGRWDGPLPQILEPTHLCAGPRMYDFIASRSHLLVVGPGELDPSTLDAFRFQFDRGLDPDFAGEGAETAAVLYDLGPTSECSPVSGSGIVVPVEVTLSNNNSQIVIRPVGSLPAGHNLVIQLNPDAIAPPGAPEDYGYADWDPPYVLFPFATAPVPGDDITTPTHPDDLIERATDLMQFGNLTMVAENSMAGGFPVAKILAVDTSTTTQGAAGGSYRIHAQYESIAGQQTRAFATDGHNRLFFNQLIGSTWSVNTIVMEDVRPGGDFTPVTGAVRTAYTLGAGPPTTASEWLALGAIPAGIPVDLEVVVSDEVGDALALNEFVDHYEATLGEPDDEGLMAVSFDLESTNAAVERTNFCPGECAYDRFQRTTVKNLTTGQSWSQDIENSWDVGEEDGLCPPGHPGTATFEVTARAGDRLQVRHNIHTLGYIAIIGSGITVIDLNRMYRLDNPDPSSPGGSQCYRRIGQYQGQDLEFPSCAPGLHNGIDMTSSVAVLGETGCDEDGRCRGATSIDAYSPLNHVNVIHTSARRERPGDLGFAEDELFDCLKWIKTQVVYDSGLGGDRWIEVPVMLRDVTAATDVSWVDRGVYGTLDGLFTVGEPPTEPVRTGDLLFVSLGDAGVYVFDVSNRSLPNSLIGHLRVHGHSIHRLQVDAARDLLFAGGYSTAGPLVQVWDIAAINGAPDILCGEGVTYCPEGTGTSPRPLVVLDNVPWTTNHLALDVTGTGLLRTVRDGSVMAVPFDSPAMTFVGLFQPEEGSTGQPGSPAAEDRPTRGVVPLGVPMEVSLSAEKANRNENDRESTAVVKLRVALPGSLGAEVTAKIQSLRVLPEQKFIGQQDLGLAEAPYSGACEPGSEVVVTLRRVGLGGDDPDASPGDLEGELGPLGNGYDLYESLEKVVLLADPRAWTGYERQDIEDSDVNGAEHTKIADEEGQCRRCSWPDFLPDPASLDPGDIDEFQRIKELVVTGPYLRAFLYQPVGCPATPVDRGDPAFGLCGNVTADGTTNTADAIAFFESQGDNYRAPSCTVEVAAWLDDVPAPIQASLAEPPLNPSIWSPGEAGISLSLVAGEAMLDAADHSVPGRSLSFFMSRSYRSGLLGAGPLGPAGWTGRLFAHLREIPTTGEVEYHDGAGHVWRYYPYPGGYDHEEPDSPRCRNADGFYAIRGGYDVCNPVGGYIAPKGLYLDLTRTEGGGWRLVGRHNDMAVFDADGRLVELSDRHRAGQRDPEAQGSTMFLEYDIFGQLVAVEDDFGRRYRLSYNEDASSPHYGLLETVTDFADREIAYGFDDRARLVEVRMPEVTTGAGDFVTADFPFEGDADDRPTLSYRYHDAGTADGVPENAEQAILHGCFANYRLEGFTLPDFPVESDDGTGDLRARFTYRPDSGRVATIGFPSGPDYSSWTFDDETPPADAAPATGSVVVAPWLHEQTYTIEDGRTKHISEEVAVTAPDGAPVPTEVTTSFDYEIDGRLKLETYPDLGEVETVYATDPGTRRAAANRDFVTVRGNFGPAAHGPVVSTFDYSGNSDNLIDGVADPIDRRIDLAVPEVPSKEEDYEETAFEPSGPTETRVSRSYQYDLHGRIKEILGGDVPTTKNSGTGPRLSLSYGVDENGRAGAGLLRSATQGNDLSQLFDYDRFDNVNAVTNETFGAESRAIYDEWDRTVSTVAGQQLPESTLRSVGSGACLGSLWGANGGMLTDRAFDAAGHLVRERRCQDVIDTSGPEPVITSRWVETRYFYNRREQLVRVEQNQLATPGLPGAVDDIFRTTLELEYDDAGRMTTQTVPNTETTPLVTSFGYDDAGRVETVTVGSGADATTRRQGYDENGRVNYRFDGHEGAWFGEYDVMGRLYRQVLPTGAEVIRIFDAAGNVLDETVRDATTLELLSRTATYYTSFGAADMTVEFLDATPATGDDLRITKRIFDTSGRTSQVISGPVENPGSLDTPFQLVLDGDRDRRELQVAYEPFGTRPVSRLYGGCNDPLLPDACPAEYQENLLYDAFGGNIPWPDRTEILERVPGRADPELTLSTTYSRDVQGRPLVVESSDGSRLSTIYDRLGGAIRTETGAGTVNLSVFDGRGLPVAQIRPSPRGATIRAYDIDGRTLAEITNDNSGSELWRTTFHYDAANNTRGLVSRVDHPDGSFETFDYYPDDTVFEWANRDGITVGFDYDPANRPTSMVPSGATPATMVPLDAGDFTGYDPLSRLTTADRAPPGSPTAFRVDYPSYDLGGRPTAELVGARPPLAWVYDVYDRPTDVTLPVGVGRDVGDVFTGYRRSWDTLDRLTGIGAVDGGGSPLPDLGADWIWGGASRLYGITSRGPLATAVRYGYIDGAGPQLPIGAPSGATWKLGTLTYGAGSAGPTAAPTHSWGAFGYGWRGADTDPKDGMKIGRRVLADGAGLLASMGWSWHLDNGLRLVDAHAGPGSFTEHDAEGSFESFSFGYGDGDQLTRTSRSTGGLVEYEHSPAPYGRIEARNGVPFGYDGSGRRTADDRFEYRWDWRGRLYEVTVLADAGTPYDGHQVRYEYDALGRLLYRVHLAEDDGSGDRPFIEYRAYLWEGNGLLAEAGYGSHDGTWDEPDTDLFLRWRKSYVPGASGLDDAVQVRVQTVLPTASDTTYSYLRDELGTVLGLVEEAEGADPEAPPLLVRYLYTPYGEVHAESGPELRAVLFDNEITEVTTSGGTIAQTVANPTTHAEGVLALTLSLPAAEDSLAAGLVLTDATTSTALVPGADYAVGRPDDDLSTLLLLPLAGWERSHDYRVTLTTDLTDATGRPLVHPRQLTWDIPTAGAVSSPTPPDLTPEYDSIIAASADLGGAFPGGQTALFQGQWTDPVTGLSYARNRWYDARTANWLSEDPLGAVDSPNLYAFVAWGPHVGRDPMGLGDDYNLPQASPAKPGPLRPDHHWVTWCEKDPERCAEIRGGIWRGIKSLVWADEIRETVGAFGDDRAPIIEKSMAATVLVLAVADVAGNALTGGGKKAVVEGGTTVVTRAVARETAEQSARLVDDVIESASDALKISDNALEALSLRQQRELARLARETRDEMVNDFDVIFESLSEDQLAAMVDDPWLMNMYFGSALEVRVAEKIDFVNRLNPGGLLSDIRWTGKTNSPFDFYNSEGFRFDVTGSSPSSIRTHMGREGVDAVVTYDSIPSELVYEFMKWLDE